MPPVKPERLWSSQRTLKHERSRLHRIESSYTTSGPELKNVTNPRTFAHSWTHAARMSSVLCGVSWIFCTCMKARCEKNLYEKKNEKNGHGAQISVNCWKVFWCTGRFSRPKYYSSFNICNETLDFIIHANHVMIPIIQYQGYRFCQDNEILLHFFTCTLFVCYLSMCCVLSFLCVAFLCFFECIINECYLCVFGERKGLSWKKKLSVI